MEPLVEVRMPTYRRPVLLRRALASLISQTYPHWRCLVLDDDNGGKEAKLACAEFNDGRIVYRQNETNLGVGANSNRAFSLHPSPGTTHACVLEDDNYYLPDCLKSNLEIMAREDVDIVMRNQWIETPNFSTNSAIVGPRTKFDGQYVEGCASRDELWGTFFYNIGANVPSLFWRVGVGLDFCTLKMIDCPVYQERLSTLCIDRRVYIAMTPQIVFRNNESESWRPNYRGIHHLLQHIRLTNRERHVCRMLFSYLRDHNLETYFWHSRLRKIDARSERVFWRVGIPLGIATKLSTKVRMTLVIKRILAKMAGLIIAEPVRYKIGKDRIEARR